MTAPAAPSAIAASRLRKSFHAGLKGTGADLSNVTME